MGTDLRLTTCNLHAPCEQRHYLHRSWSVRLGLNRRRWVEVTSSSTLSEHVVTVRSVTVKLLTTPVMCASQALAVM